MTYSWSPMPSSPGTSSDSVASKIDDFLETHLKIPEKPGSDISESLFRAGYVVS